VAVVKTTPGCEVVEKTNITPRVTNGEPRLDARKSPDDVTAPMVQDLDSQLYPHYQFDNYIEGESNRLARSVGESIANNPAKTFNPFFVYGPSGCGKTHLISAIGTRIKEHHPQMRVLYLSAHLFTVQYTDAVRQNKVNDFIRFYQTIDTLILDDVQELSGKIQTQNTFSIYSTICISMESKLSFLQTVHLSPYRDSKTVFSLVSNGVCKLK
jgi:chromosomal replication initiator protein